MKAKQTKIAIGQINPILGDLSRNLSLHEEMVERARQQGVNIIVFPELSLTGYFVKDLVPSLALSVQSPHLDRLKTLSSDISIVVGLVEESSDYRFFNSAILLEAGEVRHVHRKIYLPTYECLMNGDTSPPDAACRERKAVGDPSASSYAKTCGIPPPPTSFPWRGWIF